VRKSLLLLIQILILPSLAGDSRHFTFLEDSVYEENSVDPALEWKVQKTIDIDTNRESVFSFKYHPDGKSILVGTTDFNLFRIRLSDGSQIWKTPAKMMFQKEFDGPTIFDVSPEGKNFLTVGQTRPDLQASERFLVLRSTENGRILKSFPVEHSLFHSVTAAIDYRYPGKEEEERRLEAELGKNWIMTIDQAVFIEGGKKILASYKHNMDGPNFYDRRLILYDVNTGSKLNDFQLTCDPKSANWDQPAGFEIAAFQFPYVYSEKKKTILFGTAHGRIHEINESLMSKNMKTPLVENKPAGSVIFTPLSDSNDVEVKDRQTIRSMALSPDGSLLYVSAGIDSGLLQFYVFDMETKKQLFSSSKINAGKMIIPSTDFLAVSGMYGSSKFYIVHTKAGKLVFSSEKEGVSMNASIFSHNPSTKEIAALSGSNQITLLRPDGSLTPW